MLLFRSNLHNWVVVVLSPSSESLIFFQDIVKTPNVETMAFVKMPSAFATLDGWAKVANFAMRPCINVFPIVPDTECLTPTLASVNATQSGLEETATSVSIISFHFLTVISCTFQDFYAFALNEKSFSSSGAILQKRPEKQQLSNCVASYMEKQKVCG